MISRSKNSFKNVYNLDQTLRNYDDELLIHTLLYDSEKFNFKQKNNQTDRLLSERYRTFR